MRYLIPHVIGFLLLIALIWMVLNWGNAVRFALDHPDATASDAHGPVVAKQKYDCTTITHANTRESISICVLWCDDSAITTGFVVDKAVYDNALIGVRCSLPPGTLRVRKHAIQIRLPDDCDVQAEKE
jgi:hypothetical protein